MKVVIIGGGFCGATLAKELDNEKNMIVSLIDKNPFFEYNPSAHKCITQPGYQKNIRVNFNHFLKNTIIINESVQEVTPSSILTDNRKIDFDYAVICTGCTYPIFLPKTEHVYTVPRSNEAKEVGKRLKEDVKKVIIVGGGYIGTEIAAELAKKRNDLEVLMVHAHDRLLERGPTSASKHAKRFLQNNGVKFIFNEKIIDHPSEKKYITKGGKEIKADICIWCAGIAVDASFIKDFRADITDKTGRIKVNESLQIINYPQFFAGGDITNILEEKTARKAELHAHLIAENLKRIRDDKLLKQYKKGKSPMIVSLGDNKGIGQFGRFVISGFLAGYGKWLVEWWTLRQFL
ncbi:MAG: FAD-dependent oxidoreductase [Candidatus Thermoplasmatota archaeon]|nr:FAD-dependent oxidoreductase [Candidatus Thermoplasmatota archaeon]